MSEENYATVPVYIRFGDIPEDFQSKVHNGCVIRNEGGVSVWDCVESCRCYYPVLPKNPNNCAINDYFDMLFSDKPVYLVTGTRMYINGACNEPLLMNDIKILKKLDYSYIRRNITSDNISEKELIKFLYEMYDKVHSDNKTVANRQHKAIDEVVKMITKLATDDTLNV